MLREGMSWCGRFQLGPLLGSGSFGDVFKVKDIKKSKRKLACKVENEEDVLLSVERRVYKHLCEEEGFPKVYWFGMVHNKRIMVMDRLKWSLDELFEDCGGQFTLKTTLLIAVQAIQRIQQLHDKGYLHRDIKPENFMMGRNHKRNVIYLIDMGLSKRYLKNDEHVPFCEGKSLTGTARYASMWALRGCEQSRRDDLISLGFVLMYFLRGSLPWQGVKERKRKLRYNMIASIKEDQITEKELCKDYPPEFQEYMSYCSKLEFTDTPDYVYLQLLFTDLLARLGYSAHDNDFDWIYLDEECK